MRGNKEEDVVGTEETPGRCGGESGKPPRWWEQRAQGLMPLLHHSCVIHREWLVWFGAQV